MSGCPLPRETERPPGSNPGGRLRSPCLSTSLRATQASGYMLIHGSRIIASTATDGGEFFVRHVVPAPADAGDEATGLVAIAAADAGRLAAGRVAIATADAGEVAAGRVERSPADAGRLAADGVSPARDKPAETRILVLASDDEVVRASTFCLIGA